MSNQKVCDVCDRRLEAEEPDPEKYVEGNNYAIGAVLTLTADLFQPADEEEGFSAEWTTDEWTLDVCATCLAKILPNLKEVMKQANREINGV